VSRKRDESIPGQFAPHIIEMFESPTFNLRTKRVGGGLLSRLHQGSYQGSFDPSSLAAGKTATITRCQTSESASSQQIRRRMAG
jgi:hypothetical protein